MATLVALVVLSVCYAVFAGITGFSIAWGAFALEMPRLALAAFAVPFVFGLSAGVVCRGRVARLPLLVLIAPAVNYALVLLIWDLSGRPRDPMGATAHLSVLGPQMLLAGAGALLWSWYRSRAVQRG